MSWDDLLDLMTLPELRATRPETNQLIQVFHMRQALERIRFYASLHPHGREYAHGAIERFVKAVDGSEVTKEQVVAAYDMRIKVMEAAPMN